MNSDRAADTQASSRSSLTADLMAEAEAMVAAEGSDSTEEGGAALSEAKTGPDETASEGSTAKTTPPPKKSQAPAGEPSEAQRSLDATLAQVAEMQQRFQEERARAEQLEKDRRETQSYGDRRRNEMAEALASRDAEIAELKRQVQAVSTRQASTQEDADDFYGTREQPQVPDLDNHPVVAKLSRQNDILMHEIAELKQARETETQRTQEVSKEAELRSFLSQKAVNAAKRVYRHEGPVADLPEQPRKVIHAYLTAYAYNRPDLAEQILLDAVQAETEARVATVRDKASRSRVISEAGMSSASDDHELDESMDSTRVFEGLDFDFRDLPTPQVNSKMFRQLVEASERMAKAPA